MNRKKERDFSDPSQPDKKKIVDTVTSPLETVHRLFYFGALTADVEDLPFDVPDDSKAPIYCVEIDNLYCE